MEAENDKLRNHFKNESIQKPSTDFTKLVMEKVEDIAETPLVFKPLIAKRQWIYIIGIAALAIASSLIFDLVSVFQKFTPIFSMESIDLTQFLTTFKVGVGVVSLLIILTGADLIYRKMKNLA